MKDVMIDIETLGTRSTSAIIQIGACYFDRRHGIIGNKFSMNIVHSDMRFTTDEDTIKWWEEQSPKARECVFFDGVSIEKVLKELSFFLKGAKYLWSHATFDIPIILNAYHVCGMKIPMHYKQMRDIRTLMDLADHTSKTKREGIHHNALDDCKYQVAYCVEAMNKLK